MNKARTSAATGSALWEIPDAVTRTELRPGHAAGRVVGPVAVEADHAPFHPPADAEPAGGFQDRIVDRMARAVRDARDTIAEPARDRLGGAAPWPECRFPDAVDAEDFQVGSPELGFLVAELGVDLDQH